MSDKKKNGGIPARIGKKFSEEIGVIQDARLRNGKSKDRVSLEKISNLIVRHTLWDKIKVDLINATAKEVEDHGLE